MRTNNHLWANVSQQVQHKEGDKDNVVVQCDILQDK